eukprot:CAMPEP_0113937910 /NCGR_PEP_ID=MMETSP1339-20121228/4400_1 /TAXON_ID=94617 /ORGANISM="Fibrocapsa japonica" /LENGTH=263 /DNA_ID=CAMNT_0000940823 /DNA_START=134 /DNA_END=925 /DNA_ORIENTATION=+ /assembly_acc=CAM_ASM_000762
MVGDSDANESLTKPINKWQSYSLVLSHILVIVVACLVVGWASMSSDSGGLGGLQGGAPFSWHPVCMVFGLIICFTEAMLSYRSFPLGKAANKIIHLTLQTVAIVFLGTGLWAVFKAHNENLYANLYSSHSWLGLTTIVLFVPQWVGGLAAFVSKSAPSAEAKKAYLPLHILVGLLTYLCAVLAVETGLSENSAFSSCGYSVSTPDKNPASHWHLVSPGCKAANALAITVVALALCALATVIDIHPKDTKERLAQSSGEKEPLI